MTTASLEFLGAPPAGAHMGVVDIILRFQMKYLAKLIFLYCRRVAREKTKYPKSNMTVEELFEGLLEANNIETDYGCYPHMNSSNGSSQWTSRIVQYLQEVTDGKLQSRPLDVQEMSPNSPASADGREIRFFGHLK